MEKSLKKLFHPRFAYRVIEFKDVPGSKQREELTAALQGGFRIIGRHHATGNWVLARLHEGAGEPECVPGLKFYVMTSVGLLPGPGPRHSQELQTVDWPTFVPESDERSIFLTFYVREDVGVVHA